MKRRLPILVLLLACLGVLGLSSLGLPRGSPFCAQVNVAEARVLCDALVQNDPELCPSNRLNDSCFHYLAMLRGEATLCDRIISKARDTCRQDVAILTRDEKLCHDEYRFSEWRDDCYISIAEAKKNAEICNSIEDSDEKAECLAVTTGNTSYCTSPSDRPFCLAGMAIAAGNGSLCKLLVNDSNEFCASLVGRILRNATNCQQIRSDAERAYCLALATANTSLCSATHKRNACLTDVAMSLKDTSICEGMDDAYDRDYCLYRIAFSRCDIGFCSTYVEEGRLACYLGMLDPPTCRFAQDGTLMPSSGATPSRQTAIGLR